MFRTTFRHIRSKKHVWITVLGMIILLSWYDRLLRSILIANPVAVVEPQQTVWYQTRPVLPVVQKQSSSTTKMKDRKETVKPDSPTTSVADHPSTHRVPIYHVVFSTSCSLQQDWESYVFFYHCRRVRQLGNITRIVSGCTPTETVKVMEFFTQHILTLADPTIQTFQIHFTPSYGSVRLTEGKYPYKYMNKPYGLRHWMETHLLLGWTEDNTTITSPYSKNIQQHEEFLDGIIILMDPDMVLLRPITHDFSGDNIVWAKEPVIKQVVHGNPISQQDGYLSNEWTKFDFSYITGDPSIRPPPQSEGPLHWNTGPPYLATVLDMYKIVSLWTETAPRVLDVYPELFAEMYGFVIATVMLKLPFHMTSSIVVSTTSTTDREGWSFVDALPDDDVCQAAIHATNVNSSSLTTLPALPIGLHYCGVYLLGKVRERRFEILLRMLLI
jgi:peptidyl serine alpha-galactosyltransferase